MSSKRKFSDYTADSSAAGKTHEHGSSHHGSKNKRKKGPSQDRPTSVNWLKKRARTIERRLNREDGLPANVQHELEKELDHHRQKLDHIADSRQRSNMIKKYHMVRFFEKKKATRLAKQIQTQLDAATDKEEKKKLKANLHIAEVDALYAKYYPHRERYISLYPVSSDAGGETKTEDASSAARSLHTERPPLWGVIEKAAEDGIPALVQIQERKSAADAQSKPSPPESSKQPLVAKTERSKAKKSSTRESAGSRRDRKQQQPPPEASGSGGDDDSDGGFFIDG
ncbi:hypothetical protein F4861DRAFT_519295 [Xylaria intraflava]|nr:hypothetical protein F4861DRAFT_519295 [Xylaria intraflava]